jgi:sporulation protein YlmC with PRC-barrel domain
MRKSLITAAAFALVAMPALAQGPGSPTMPGNPPTTAGAPVATPRAPKPNPLAQDDLSRVTGTAVYGADGKKLGSVETVLMNPQSKEVDRLVVKAGGVLGVGGRDVAIPVDQFSWDISNEGFKLAKTTDELKSMPEWQSASSSARSSYGSAGSTSTTATGSGTVR